MSFLFLIFGSRVLYLFLNSSSHRNHYSFHYQKTHPLASSKLHTEMFPRLTGLERERAMVSFRGLLTVPQSFHNPFSVCNRSTSYNFPFFISALSWAVMIGSPTVIIYGTETSRPPLAPCLPWPWEWQYWIASPPCPQRSPWPGILGGHVVQATAPRILSKWNNEWFRIYHVFQNTVHCFSFTW